MGQIQFALFGDVATMPPLGLVGLDVRRERVLCECLVVSCLAIRLAFAASARWIHDASNASRFASRLACDAALASF